MEEIITNIMLQGKQLIQTAEAGSIDNNTMVITLLVIGILCLAAGLVMRIRIIQGKSETDSRKREEQEAVDGMIKISNLHHIGKRENQQDAFGISSLLDEKLYNAKGVLAAVADGMGGLEKGAEVSALVISHMLTEFSRLPDHLDTASQLLQLVMGANNKVVNYLERTGNAIGGSTVVAVIIKDRQMHFISVGDSHIYLLRDGVLTILNREHTYASQLDEKVARGDLSYLEAQNDPQRKALTSYIGLAELTLIDRNVSPMPLRKGDRILLMTDGVFGTLNEAEIIASVSAENVYEATKQLEKAVIEKRKQGQDNFTAVIIEVGGQ